jgi:hypothetical protein
MGGQCLKSVMQHAKLENSKFGLIIKSSNFFFILVNLMCFDMLLQREYSKKHKKISMHFSM